MSIYAKRIDESIITPKDDRILFDAIFDNYGLIYGGSAKMSAVNKINVGAARGFIKGTEIIVEEEDIAVELSDSGTKSGRLKIIVDYTNTENPVAFTSEVATSLPALEQDDLINYTNGVYEVAYATYTASETSISDVKLVMPTLETVKEKLKRLNTDLKNLNKEVTDLSNESNIGHIMGWGRFLANNTPIIAQNVSVSYSTVGSYVISVNNSEIFDGFAVFVTAHKSGGHSVTALVTSYYASTAYVEFRDTNNALTDVTEFSVLVVGN